MKTILSRIAPFLLLMASLTEGRGQDQAALHAQLAGIYGHWRNAMVGKDLARWKLTTSQRRQVVVKNRIHSERRAFPATLFALPVAPPDLKGLKALQLKSKGPTAKVVYFGKVDFGVGGKPSDNLFVLDFVSEGGRWKYDGAEFVNISALGETRKELQGGNLKFLASKDFEPSGVIERTPFAVRGPVKYIAKAYVYCPGREVRLQINKISRHTFQNTKRAEIVIGGALDGNNEVQFAIKSLPGSEGTEPMVFRVYLLSEVQGVKPITILEHELKEKEVLKKASGTLMFRLDAAVAGKLKGR